MKRYVDSGGGAVVFLLSLCFLLGIFAGRGAALCAFGSMDAAAYISGFVSRRCSGYPAALPVFAYFRYPAAAFALGFVPLGAVLIPAALFLEAFSLSFAVNLFTLSLSEYGLVLAIAAMGFRYLFILPCLFYISALSLRRALARAGAVRREKRGRRNAAALSLCAGILCAGAAAEQALLPLILTRLASLFA